ncbi:host cell division inhibitor Icd-like protein [Klebsiella quasipneumoniae]|uniref:host cell division inhibitor Icd-like protein n=1 Tax=Klebsiella quasipneumoniae TaxID=1463165 RepID=UPI002B05DF04|nr:host cell division inhibitor Icd-like protein [Klebsiella quasipneumoniae]
MITGARRKSLSLAGLMYAKVNALQAVRHRGNLSKPVTLRATDSGVQNAWQSFETITPAGKRSETDYLEDSVSGAGGGCGAHHTASYKLPHRNKKGLRPDGIPVYGYRVPAKSGARIGVLTTLKATHDAPSVFFCAVSLTHPFFERWYIIQRLSRAMVAQAGASSEAPVSFRAGYANPVWATTSEIGVSGGGVTRYLKEAATMATTPTQNSQFIWIIAAVRRDMTTIKAQIHHIAAPSERDARRSLVRDHVCFFAGRIRLEVAHA